MSDSQGVVRTRATKRTVALATVVVTALAFLSVRAIGAESTDGTRVTGPPLPAGIGLADIPGAEANRLATEAYERQLEKDKAEANRLDGPQASAARIDSRDDFVSDDSSGEVEKLLQQEFSAELAFIDADPGRALDDLTVRKFFGPSAALVAGDGRPVLLDSPTPLRAEADSGQTAPLDLDIARENGHFGVENPLVDTVLPAKSQGTLAIGPELELTVRASGGENVSGQPTDDQRLIYSQALGTDTDLIIAPVTTGVDVSTLIRSPNSPETYTLALDIPAGASVKRQPDGSVEVQKGDESIAHVLAPAAIDAQGQTVPSFLEVNGSQIDVVTDFKGGDYAFPIFTDPIIDVFNWANNSGSTAGWGFASNNTGNGSSCQFTWGFYAGLIAYGPGSCVYKHSTWGQWLYYPPGQTTFINQATFNPISFSDSCNIPNGQQPEPHGYVGVYKRAATPGWRMLQTFGPPVPSQSINSYPGNHYSAPLDVAVAGVGTPQFAPPIPTNPPPPDYGSWCQRTLHFGGATIKMSDPESPAVTNVSTSLGGAWTSSTGNATVSYAASDPGLGVVGTGVNYPKVGGNWANNTQLVGGANASCTATPASPCPSSLPTSGTTSVTIPLNDFGDGVTTANVWAWDPLWWGGQDNWNGITHLGAAPIKVKIDRAKPRITEVNGVPIDGPPDPVALAGTTLDIKASDVLTSAPATATSGVKEIRVLIDNVQVYPDPSHPDEVRCDPSETTHGSCPSTDRRNVQLPLAQVSGTHTYKIVAVDQAGTQSDPVQWTETVSQESVSYATSSDTQGPPGAVPLLLAKPDNDGDDCPTNGVKRGKTWIGTECADRIGPIAGVKIIRAGGGPDRVVGGAGGQRIYGEGGDDVLIGERDNDVLIGGQGGDRLVGGIGDDSLQGEGKRVSAAGNDVLEGGQGTDTLVAGPGNDVIRGGATQDYLSGGNGDNDTLSFTDGTTPGFQGNPAAATPDFPGSERGVFVQLGASKSVGGPPQYAGSGVDKLFIRKCTKSAPNTSPRCVRKGIGGFERIVGSPYNDIIVGTSGPEIIDGGPGADVIRGNGGADKLYGGADGDYLNGGSSAAEMRGEGGTNNCANGNSVSNCDGTSESVAPRQADKLKIGFAETGANASLYVSGTNDPDSLRAEYKVASPNDAVVFTPRNTATKNAISDSSVEGCAIQAAKVVRCELPEVLGSIVIYGAGGSDDLDAQAFPRAVSPFIVGGPGTDHLRGGRYSDSVVDGTDQGADREELVGGAGDDLVANNDGPDLLKGKQGNDLMLNASLCPPGGGDTINGGEDDDNAQWAKLPDDLGFGVYANLQTNQLGRTGSPQNHCHQGPNFNDLLAIEDLETSPVGDILIGDGGGNLILGRGGPDRMYGGGGKDLLYAYDDARDPVIDCGAGLDSRAIVNRGLDQGNFEGEPIIRDCVPPPLRYKGKFRYLRESFMADRSDPELDGISDEFDLSGDVERAAPAAFYRVNDPDGSFVGNSAEDDGFDGDYKTKQTGAFMFEQDGASDDAEEDSAVALNGNGAYLELTNAWDPEAVITNPALDGGYSVGMWVKFDPAGSGRQSLFSRRKESRGIQIYRDTDGQVVFESAFDLGRAVTSTDDSVSTGEWHHIMGTLTSNRIVLYVDGYAFPVEYQQAVTPGPSASAPNIVGAPSKANGEAGDNQFLKGVVDEISIYEQALGQDEVILEASEGIGPIPSVMLKDRSTPADGDNDGFSDSEDNCVTAANADQADADEDGVGDACDVPLDSDGDDVADDQDNCSAYNPDQADLDSDGIGDVCAVLPDP